MSKSISILKITIATIMLTVVLIFVGALISYWLKCDDSQMDLLVSAIYAISCFFFGFLLAGVERRRRLLCGMIAGFTYFAIVIIIALILSKGLDNWSKIVSRLLICLASGIIGAILKK